jgi:hypothetical protein
LSETGEIPEPYRIYPIDMPFAKTGWPVAGNFGARARRVVVMDAITFQRMVKEHPSLATARFEVAE